MTPQAERQPHIDAPEPPAWRRVAVGRATGLRPAMEVLDRGGMQIVLVMDDDGRRLLGTVTDGDIRRALLKGCDMNAASVAEVMNPNPTTGLIDEGRALWQRNMQRNNLKHLPLLDGDGCVVDLVRFELPEEPARDNPFVIMAGGLGTRLRPLTNDVPKPMIPVGSRPVLETIIDNIARQGFRNVHLCINYMGDVIRDHFGDGSRWDLNISYIEERQRLGTAGALSLLPESPVQDLIVMNGDLLTNVDFVRLLDFHRAQGFIATMAIREYRHQVPYGVLVMGDGYRMQSITEKPIHRFPVNAGIYVLSPAALALIPPQQPFDMTQVFEAALAADRAVGCFPHSDYWIDIGRLEDLERAHNDFREFFGD